MFGWGAKDTSTPQERKDWRDNAKAQMDKDKPTKDKKTGKDDTPPRHANKTSWW